MKKILFAALLTLGITCSSCLGPNNAYRSLQNWNAELSDVDAVNEVVFLAMWIIPVYGIAQLLDIVIFNTIDYWVEGDVLKDPGPFPGFEYKRSDKAADE